MDWLAIMKKRHSVRQYTDRKIPDDIRKKLTDEVMRLNLESGLRMQIFFDEPECFDAAMAHYGKFTGVQNYLLLSVRKERIWKKEQAIMVNALFCMRRVLV